MVPEGAPAPFTYGAIDMHVHLHPAGLGAAIRRHFAQEHSWGIPHPFEPDAVVATLRAHGIERFCCFSYAHKPGMARSLNRWIAETAARFPEAIPLGTLHVDDPDLPNVLSEALDVFGLAGFKFHISVQRFFPDDSRLLPVYERAEAEGRIVVFHVGTAPYRDPFTGVSGFRRVMQRFPRLRVSVAHLGAFETAEFFALMETFPHLYLDTSMALTPLARPYVGIDADAVSTAELLRRHERILYGSDFPMIPYPYEEERRWAWERGLPPTVQRKIFRENALRFLGALASSGA